MKLPASLATSPQCRWNECAAVLEAKGRGLRGVVCTSSPAPGPRVHWDSPEPVGESHHDIKRSQEEDKVEEEVAVGHPLALVVDDPLAAFALVVRHKVLLHWRKQDTKTNRQPINIPPKNFSFTILLHFIYLLAWFPQIDQIVISAKFCFNPV